jgi:hypothetical protein
MGYWRHIRSTEFSDIRHSITNLTYPNISGSLTGNSIYELMRIYLKVLNLVKFKLGWVSWVVGEKMM